MVSIPTIYLFTCLNNYFIVSYQYKVQGNIINIIYYPFIGTVYLYGYSYL